jgi:hypothetical protein
MYDSFFFAFPVSLGPLSRAYAKFRKAIISFFMSGRHSAWNNTAPVERIFVKFDTSVFFENLSRTFKFHSNLTRVTGTLHEDQNTFFVIPRSLLLRIRNVSDRSCRENQNTHFRVNNLFFENRSFYKIMWKKFVELVRPQMTTWRMLIACRIPTATNTHSEL